MRIRDWSSDVCSSDLPSGGWLQSSPIIPDLGFCLGNRAQMFWLDERSPSALAPRKRPRTTLSPGFALRDGKPYMAFGTPGGDQQDQRSEEHTSELQSLMRSSYAVFCLKKKKKPTIIKYEY